MLLHGVGGQPAPSHCLCFTCKWESSGSAVQFTAPACCAVSNDNHGATASQNGLGGKEPLDIILSNPC